MIYVCCNLGRSPNLDLRNCKHTERNLYAIHPPSRSSKPAPVFFLSIFYIWVWNVTLIKFFFFYFYWLNGFRFDSFFVLGFWVFYQRIESPIKDKEKRIETETDHPPSIQSDHCNHRHTKIHPNLLPSS